MLSTRMASRMRPPVSPFLAFWEGRWGALVLLLGLLVPGRAAAWPVDQAVRLEPGKERFQKLSAVEWVEVEDASVVTAEVLAGSSELLLTGLKPGRTLLLLYAEGKFAVWRLEVSAPGRPLEAEPPAPLLAAARKACPGLKTTEGAERLLVAEVKDGRCRSALLAYLKTDAYLARELELTFEMAVLQEQLQALTPALKALGLSASYHGAGAGAGGPRLARGPPQGPVGAVPPVAGPRGPGGPRERGAARLHRWGHASGRGRRTRLAPRAPPSSTLRAASMASCVPASARTSPARRGSWALGTTTRVLVAPDGEHRGARHAPQVQLRERAAHRGAGGRDAHGRRLAQARQDGVQRVELLALVRGVGFLAARLGRERLDDDLGARAHVALEVGGAAPEAHAQPRHQHRQHHRAPAPRAGRAG